MPIYEYDCAKCEDSFEELVVRSDEEVSCPSCGTTRVERKLSVFGVGASTSAASAPPPQNFCGPGGGCGRPQCE